MILPNTINDSFTAKTKRGSKTKELWKNPEYRANMVRTHLGKKCSMETKEKMRIAQLGKPSKLIGRKMPAKHKKAISDALKGIPHSPEHVAKRSGEKSTTWKGENAGYFAKHCWINKVMGRERICKICNSTSQKRYEWANISGEYKREITDWIRLCAKCHRQFDEKKGRGSATKKFNVHKHRYVNKNKK